MADCECRDHDGTRGSPVASTAAHLAGQELQRRLEARALVRLEAARYVLEQAGAATEKVAAIDVQVGIQQNNVQIEVAETLRDVTRELPDILRALVEMDPEKHVRQGDDALPQALLQNVATAERRAEVVDAEFAEAHEDGDE